MTATCVRGRRPTHSESDHFGPNCDLPGSCGHDRFCLNAGHPVVP
jgi:hypothetical protein